MSAKEVPDLNPELLELLLHVVVSHLRLPEWGSPRLPLIPEVLILHHVDDLDAKVEMFARCLTKKMLTYALGRGVEYYDTPTVDKIVTAMDKDGYKFSTLVTEIVKSDPFRMRRGKEHASAASE